MPKLTRFIYFIFFPRGLLRCSRVKAALVFPGLTAFRASFTGVILTVVLGGIAAGCGFLYPDFGGKQRDFNCCYFFLNKVCICYAQSSLRGLEVPEARGSGVPGILAPQGRDGERKSRRIGLGGKGGDGPSTANLVIGSEEPRNKPPANPMGKKRGI